MQIRPAAARTWTRFSCKACNTAALYGGYINYLILERIPIRRLYKRDPSASGPP